MTMLTLNRMHDLFGPVWDELFSPSTGRGGSAGLAWLPRVDIVERNDRIEVAMDLPGMQAEEIGLTLENNVLTISGTRSRHEEESEGQMHVAERLYGSFTRSFAVPFEVNGDEIEARYENGVLQVSLPKAEQARPRRIEIHAGGEQHRLEANTGAKQS